MSRRTVATVQAALCICLLCSDAHAQEQKDQDAGKDAGAVQTGAPVLNTYAEKLRYWQSLSEEQRRQIRARARNITRSQLHMMRQRQRQFRKLAPEEQARLRHNYERFRQASPEKRRDYEQRFRRFQRLPEEQRRELRRRACERMPGQGPAGHRQGMREEMREEMLRKYREVTNERDDYWREFRGPADDQGGAWQRGEDSGGWDTMEPGRGGGRGGSQGNGGRR